MKKNVIVSVILPNVCPLERPEGILYYNLRRHNLRYMIRYIIQVQMI